MVGRGVGMVGGFGYQKGNGMKWEGGDTWDDGGPDLMCTV